MVDYTESNESLLQLAALGDKDAQDKLVEQNTGLVHSVVRRFSGRGQESEDLFQVGCIGLIKAVQKFDQSFGVKFSTYAVPMILGEIKRFIRDDGIIKVSRSIKETASRAMALREEWIRKIGREPTIAELAEKLAITPAELSTALESGIRPSSLYAIRDDGNRESQPLFALIESDTDYETQIVNKLTLQKLMAEFPIREQTILHLRYFKQKTQTEIAQVLGISQVQVSRIEKKLLLTMREKLQLSG